MKPLTVELFLGALSLAALGACSRKAEPDPSQAPAPQVPVTATAAASMPVAPVNPPSVEPDGKATALVDAGKEVQPPKHFGLKPAPAKGVQAACGAGGCSADMKKGGK